MSSNYTISCLNYNNPVRKESMTARFKQVGITDFTMFPGVPLSDPRINQSLEKNTQKSHSCMFGHLDMIRAFLETSESPFGIFCEDDIKLDANFIQRMDTILRDFKHMNLDVLLLGYLYSRAIELLEPGKNVYHSYSPPPATIWGTQMYMMSREWARAVISKYGNDDSSAVYYPFSADWTITQEGNRRIVYPMLAIEDGTGNYEDEGQAYLHSMSHSAHLGSSAYI
jgi:GR25 family glycosyltransferase involved in LPS biosynthesis